MHIYITSLHHQSNELKLLQDTESLFEVVWQIFRQIYSLPFYLDCELHSEVDLLSIPVQLVYEKTLLPDEIFIKL